MKMKPTTIAVVATSVTLAAVFFAFMTSTEAKDPEEKDFPNDLTPASTMEEQLKWKKEFTAWAEANNQIIHIAGEETKGSTIEINGTTVQLPPDAFVRAFIVIDDGLLQNEETRAYLPFYVIQRGDEIVRISQNTGVLLDQTVSSVDPKTFDFLQSSIKGEWTGVK